VFGEILKRFHPVTYGCGAVILLSLIIRAVLGPRPRRFAIRLTIAAGMLAATMYSGMVLAGRIDRVQEQIGITTAASSLPANDPRRLEFGRLHGQSTLIQLVPLLGGVVLMLSELND
jgi:hypothetical protein